VHTDAAQAIGKIPVDVTDLDVDYLTVVGHKVSLSNMNVYAHYTKSNYYPTSKMVTPRVLSVLHRLI